MFIAREEELRTIRKSLKGKRKSTILLYGRRRVGKTSLIMEAIKDIDDSIVIYHEFHRVTLEQNIAEFTVSIGRAFGFGSMPSFASLPDVFSFIGHMGKKAVVIMDEYSDMKENARPGEVDSYMRTVIDNLPDCISLIVTGSIVKVMEELLDEDNPLFSRFSSLIKLRPLDYYDSARFFPSLSRMEQLRLYAVFGGSPYVLSLLDGEDGLEGNIQEKIISISGSVRAYIEAIINTETARIPHGITILSLIRNGKRRYSELEDVIGKDASGVLNKELRKLVELDAVSRVVPINRNEKGRTFYEISDPLLRFYFTYIYPNPAILMSNPEVFFDSFIARSIPDFIARRFEAACKEYFARLVRKGIRTDILDIGSYWYDDRERHTNGEFDVVLEFINGYDVFEVKFLSRSMSEEMAKEEAEKIREIKSFKARRIGFISLSGFSFSSDEYVLVDGDMLFSKP